MKRRNARPASGRALPPWSVPFSPTYRDRRPCRVHLLRHIGRAHCRLRAWIGLIRLSGVFFKTLQIHSRSVTPLGRVRRLPLSNAKAPSPRWGRHRTSRYSIRGGSEETTAFLVSVPDPTPLAA